MPILPVIISRISLQNAGQKKFFEEKENCSGLDIYRSETKQSNNGVGRPTRLSRVTVF